jgi:hypothetical protein
MHKYDTKKTFSSSEIPKIQGFAIIALAKQPEFIAEEKIPCAVCGEDGGCYVHIVASGVHQDDTLRLNVTNTDEGRRKSSWPLGSLSPVGVVLRQQGVISSVTFRRPMRTEIEIFAA